jgi:hypothetical protein
LNLHLCGTFEQGEEPVIGADVGDVIVVVAGEVVVVVVERAAARLLRKGLRSPRDGRVEVARVLARPRGIVEGGPDRRLYILQESAGDPTVARW